uniref:Uncharacterized protein n=2 Tax=unclassified Caudoviricetes TaxID=2788787 RepID=A0A8S5P5L3_9CAUD|nr:MAG TPA: hypothetical protein [Siphoviridae sp. ctkyp1]DAF65405.1 MAG TPA: hypothetical protein [Siphoviridae sp. ctbbV81]DAH16925.1 MAG TPA: hypothetical protein [Caudoviricetes sp.]DAJ22220.1 MAG TPA: hypothetical protein [Siphoviridae sp. ctnoo6]DAH50860.1 MAG TPA: hypothetical protein [Caudoviricetes sp.]
MGHVAQYFLSSRSAAGLLIFSREKQMLRE